ncbi:MAG: DUF4920 domain-containing protein [Acidobacteria bacterium]|nr:DUF4920 domain-containing protein [Acidobacteriota bacterium]MCA1608378.1 DUF4920 domain-containing protein [Acidobacteriota bacterium]
MRKIVLLQAFVLIFSVAVTAQAELNSKGEPVAKNEQNAPVVLKSGDKITRGAALAKSVKRVSVEKAVANPDRLAGKTVEVEGIILRSCKKEGCWMEMADVAGGQSVRVTFGDHAFFIPLNSAGMNVRAQGVFKTSILSREKVEHLIHDDGAKFENRNEDGTVTEVSFDATGVELKKTTP